MGSADGHGGECEERHSRVSPPSSWDRLSRCSWEARKGPRLSGRTGGNPSLLASDPSSHTPRLLLRAPVPRASDFLLLSSRESEVHSEKRPKEGAGVGGGDPKTPTRVPASGTPGRLSFPSFHLSDQPRSNLLMRKLRQGGSQVPGSAAS